MEAIFFELTVIFLSIVLMAGIGVLAHFLLKGQYDPQPPKHPDTPDEDIYNK